MLQMTAAGSSPGSPSKKAPARMFKVHIGRVMEEFEEVATMLDKEIHHRVQLEHLVASLRTQLEARTEQDAAEAKSSPKSAGKANGELQKLAARAHEVPLTGDEVDFHAEESADQASTEQRGATLAHKKTHQDGLHELELIKGWQTIPDTSHRSSDLLAQMGLCRANARKVVESQPFDAVCATAIIYNAALLGASADYSAKNRTDPNDPPMFYQVSDRICTVWFLAELILRLGSEGFRNWAMGPLWSWNIFDFIVVASDVLMTILDAIAAETNVDLSFLRMLRVLRVTRAIRVVRLMRFFKELRMMVFSVLRSGTSLLWSLLLFGIIIYIFGIFLMMQVTDHLYERYEGDFSQVPPGSDEDVQIEHFEYHWKNVMSSMYTMYGCMSGAISWTLVADELHEISWINSVIMSFFIFFCTIVVMNIITGIFVDTAIQSAQNDRDEIIQEQIHSQNSELAKLKEAFLEADNDGSQTITVEEFQSHLKDPHVRAHLASIGLEIHEAMGLFKLLDIDGSGCVGVEEFVIGCMRLKGSAKSIDLATLMYENKRMVEQASGFHDFCSEKFRAILDATEALRYEIATPVLHQVNSNQHIV